MKEFNDFWKIESVKIAAMEQLEETGFLKLDELFNRAKDVYNKGYEYGIKNWKSIWSDVNEDITEEVQKPELDPGKKACPSCNEQVPEGWKKHTYKKDGSRCGHVWK